MSQTANRIVKNTGFLYAKMGITVFISLYTTRLVLNALGATDFGIFGIVGGAIAMLGFLNNSLSSATQRFLSYSQGEKDLEKQRAIFNSSIIIHLSVAIIVVVFLEFAAYPLFNGILNIPPERLYAAHMIYQFMIVSTVITIIAVPYDAAITAHENMGYYAIVGVLESILKLGIALFVVYTISDKLVVYGLLMTILSLLLLFLKLFYSRFRYTECRFQFNKYYHKHSIWEMTRFAGWSLLGSIGTVVGNNGGDVVMNHYFGPSVNAAGSVGAQLRGQMMAFSNGLLKALNPVIVKKEGEKAHSSMLRFSITGAKMSYLLFAFLALPFIADAPYILKLWLKQVPDWTICFSRLQMLTGLGEQITVTMGTVLAASGSIKNYSIFSGIAHLTPLLLYVVLFSIGAQPFWVYLICLINFVFIDRGYLLMQCRIRSDLDVNGYLKSVVIPILVITCISLGGAWCISHLMTESLVRLVLLFLFIDGILVLLSYLFLFDQEEKVIVYKALHKLGLFKNKQEI